MSITITKELAVKEDIAFGMGTVEQTRLGVVETYEEINAKHIPYNETQSVADKFIALESGTDQSLKYSLDSEANKRTAASYATEPANVEVKTYASNGDGSFTVVALTGIYSALHYESLADGNLDLQNWGATASKNTAESYATEVTDVIIWASNDDGTFTQTVQVGVDSAKTSTAKAKVSADNAKTSEAVVVEKEALVSPHYSAIDTVSTNILKVNIVADGIDGVNAYADTYQFGLAAAPLTRPDGSALKTGDMYWDIPTNEMKVFSTVTGVWKSAGSTVNGINRTEEFIVGTASGIYDGVSLNTFPLVDGYDAGFAEITLNGRILAESDYDKASGISIVLTADAVATDIIKVIAYGAFVLADHYVKAENDAQLAIKENIVDNNTKLATKLTKDNTNETKIGSLTIGESKTIDGWSYVGSVITLDVTTAGHNAKVGDTIYVSGLTSDTVIVSNGTYTIIAVTDTTIEYDSVVTQDAVTLGVSGALVKYGELKGDFLMGLPADFTSSLSSNGYQKLPSGLIIQWGTLATDTIGVAVTFPISFPNGPLVPLATRYDGEGLTQSTGYSGKSSTEQLTTTGMIVSGSGGANLTSWLVIGY